LQRRRLSRRRQTCPVGTAGLLRPSRAMEELTACAAGSAPDRATVSRVSAVNGRSARRSRAAARCGGRQQPGPGTAPVARAAFHAWLPSNHKPACALSTGFFRRALADGGEAGGGRVESRGMAPVREPRLRRAARQWRRVRGSRRWLSLSGPRRPARAAAPASSHGGGSVSSTSTPSASKGRAQRRSLGLLLASRRSRWTWNRTVPPRRSIQPRGRLLVVRIPPGQPVRSSVIQAYSRLGGGGGWRP